MFLGDHKSCFYESVNQKHHVLFSNLVYGLNAGCSALYIASGESVDAVTAELGHFGFKRDDLQKVKIVTSSQWFTPEGEFDARQVVDQYRRLIDEALDNGFAGLYVSGDPVDTFDYLDKKGMIKQWMEYENSYGATLNFPMEAICAYRVDQIKANGHIFLQLLKGHKDTISLQTDKRILNDQLIRSTVFQQIKETLGKSITATIFDQLDNYIPTQNFSSRTNESFWDVLEMVLKEGDARMFSNIEQSILTEICARIGVT